MSLYVIPVAQTQTVGLVGFTAHEASEVEVGGGMPINLENSWNGLEQTYRPTCQTSTETLIPLHLCLPRTYGLLFQIGL